MARRVTSLAEVRDIGVSREIDSAYDNVKIVAINIDAVLAISENLDAITAANTNSTNINIVGNDIGSVNTVADNIADINTAAANIVDIQNAAANAAAAASSATDAETAQTAAEAAQAAAEAALDAFDDRYLGPYTSDPTLDNDGDPLAEGTLYFNTVSDEMRVYQGVSWQPISIVGALLAANNLSELADVSTARTNLGLGALSVLNTISTTQIDDEAVNLNKLQHIATNSLLGRSTAGTGDVEIISTAELKTLYESNVDTNAFTDAEKAALASLGGEYSDYIQLSTTSPTVMEEWSASTYGGAEIAILIKDTLGGASQLSMLSVLNSAVAVSAGQYSTLLLGTADDLAELDLDISGGNVRFIVTAGSSNLTNYRMRVTLIEN